MALARMALRNPPVVLLDEATAFADPESEAAIQKGLIQCVGYVDDGAQHPGLLLGVEDVADKGHVQLDSVERQGMNVLQRVTIHKKQKKF